MIMKELRIGPPPAKASDIKGFTLAEVLITLGIIGVVAAMTMPSLIANYKVKQTVTQLKKIDSTLQNAFMYMKTTEFSGAEVENWDYMTENEFNQKFAESLKVLEVCDKGDSDRCFNDIKYTNLNGDANQLQFKTFPGMVLGDGTVLAINYLADTDPTHAARYGDYGQIFVDINGPKAPNVLGKDVFSFIIRKDKLVARGTATSSSSQSLGAASYCSTKDGAGHNGLGCTAWVIYNENMDYLKCEGLSWNGKTSCN